MKPILIVDGGNSLTNIMRMLIEPPILGLGNPVQIRVYSLEDCEKLLPRATEFSAIVWQPFICNKAKTRSWPTHGGDGPIARFAKVFKGPMFAWSELPERSRLMLIVGCTHEVPASLEKFATEVLPKVLIDI